MKEIKLSGREIAVLKAIDFGSGSTGLDIHMHTHLPDEDLLDVLNGLADVGYVEAYVAGREQPEIGPVELRAFRTARFDVNPSYALELRNAMRR